MNGCRPTLRLAASLDSTTHEAKTLAKQAAEPAVSSKQAHCVCTVTALFICCQVVEARSRHQLEREAVQRDNAQQRRELAEEERKAALEKVRDCLQEWS